MDYPNPKLPQQVASKILTKTLCSHFVFQVALIKEIKNQVEGMNLVQAKKFVESCPAVVKTDIGKDEAESLKKALEAVGAECTVE